MKQAAMVLCVLMLAAAACGAQGERRREGENDRWAFYSRKYDANRDGKVTADEYGRSKETFARLDQDGNGVLTKDDFAARRRGRGGRRSGAMTEMMFKRILSRSADENDSGTIEASEWTAFKKKLDGDGNGVVSTEELVQAGTPERFAERLVSRLDLNEDGRTSVEELGQLYGRLDKDKSGSLEKKELTMERRRRMGRRGQGGERGRKLEDGVPKPGEMAPDFKLPILGKKKGSVQLSRFKGKKPVALIFGSYT